MNSLQIAFFVAFAVTAIITNIYWYRAKVSLRPRGFASSFLTDHLSDFSYTAQLIDAETDWRLRCSFIQLRSKIKVSLLVTLALFIGFVLSSILTML